MITYHYLENGLLKTQVAQDLETIPANTIWIDLLRPTPEEEHFIESSLDIEIPSPEEMAEIEDSSRFFESKDSLCMIVSVVSGSQNMSPSLTELSFILNKKQLVCAHYGELTSFRSFETQYARQPQVFKTTDVLMMVLVDAVVDRSSRCTSSQYHFCTTIFYSGISKFGRKGIPTHRVSHYSTKASLTNHYSTTIFYSGVVCCTPNS